jgi:hypothetical protein
VVEHILQINLPHITDRRVRVNASSAALRLK